MSLQSICAKVSRDPVFPGSTVCVNLPEWQREKNACKKKKSTWPAASCDVWALLSQKPALEPGMLFSTLANTNIHMLLSGFSFSPNFHHSPEIASLPLSSLSLGSIICCLPTSIVVVVNRSLWSVTVGERHQWLYKSLNVFSAHQQGMMDKVRENENGRGAIREH